MDMPPAGSFAVSLGRARSRTGLSGQLVASWLLLFALFPVVVVCPASAESREVVSEFHLTSLGDVRPAQVGGAIVASNGSAVSLLSIPELTRMESYQLPTGDIATILPVTASSFILASGDGGMSLWDVVNGTLAQRVEPSGSAIQMAAVSPDGRYLASLEVGERLVLRHARSLDLLDSVPLAAPEGGGFPVVWDPRGTSIAVPTSHLGSPAVRVYSVPGLQLQAVLLDSNGAGQSVSSAAFLSPGALVLGSHRADNAQVATVWSVEASIPERVFDLPGSAIPAGGVDLGSRGGPWLATHDSGYVATLGLWGDLQVWDETGTIMWSANLGFGPTSAVLWLGESIVAVSRESGQIRAVRPAVEQPDRPTVEVHSPAPGTVAGSAIDAYGTAFASTGAPLSISFSIDTGSWLPAAGGRQWSVSIDASSLREGTHRLYFRSFDGTLYSLPIAVPIVAGPPLADDSPPLLELQAPPDGTIAWGPVILRGVYSDLESPVPKLLLLRVDDGNAQPFEGGPAWSTRWDPQGWPAGEHVLTVEAFDGTRTVRAQVRIIVPAVDAYPLPEIVVYAPANGTAVWGVLQLSGSTSSVVGLIETRVRAGNGSWQSAGSGAAWVVALDLTELAPGVHRIDVLVIEEGQRLTLLPVATINVAPPGGDPPRDPGSAPVLPPPSPSPRPGLTLEGTWFLPAAFVIIGLLVLLNVLLANRRHRRSRGRPRSRRGAREDAIRAGRRP